MTSPVFSHTDADPALRYTPEANGDGPEPPTFQEADTAPERDAEHAQVLPVTPDAPLPIPGPQPLFAGTYAVYDDQRGGAVLVLAQAGGDTVTKHIPAAMLKMAEKFGGGGLAGMFGGA